MEPFERNQNGFPIWSYTAANLDYESHPWLNPNHPDYEKYEDPKRVLIWMPREPFERAIWITEQANLDYESHPWLNPNHPDYEKYKDPKRVLDPSSGSVVWKPNETQHWHVREGVWKPNENPDDELGDADAAAKYAIRQDSMRSIASRRTKRKRKPKTESDYPTAKVQRALMVSDFVSRHSLHARYEPSWPMKDIEILAKALHSGESHAKSKTMNALRASAKPPVSMTNVAVMTMVRAFIKRHSLHTIGCAEWPSRATARFANLLFQEHRECFKLACTNPLPGTLRWLARICWGRSCATGPEHCL
jgi:hypothetical protein